MTVNNTVNTDSLVALWNTAWNSNDSEAIAKLMSAEVKLISENKVTSGINGVATEFIGPNAKLIKNLKTEVIASGSCEGQAYFYGSYTHDVAFQDTTKTGVAGTFSLIYVKEGDLWLIRVAAIE